MVWVGPHNSMINFDVKDIMQQIIVLQLTLIPKFV